MVDVAVCIATDHNPWLVLLAVVICCLGAFAVAQTFERARSTLAWQRLGWTFLTSVAAGATIWCTHFVAMLAYKPDVPVTLDPVLTIGSLIVAIVGTCLAIIVALANPRLAYPALGGAIFGISVSAMHYVGMVAYRIDGIVQWRWAYVVASVLCAVGFAAAAFVTLCTGKASRARIAVASGLLVAGIATLHFIAMTALRIIPLALDSTPLNPSTMNALALATGVVGIIVIAAGVLATVIDYQTRSDAMQRLHDMAMRDALTGLPNRASFQQARSLYVERARAAGSRFAAVAIDLNRFKEINDVHGHKAGDDVLVAIAHRMREVSGHDNVVARLGGDEFVALIRFDEDADLAAFAGQLDAALKAPIVIGPIQTRVGASIGIAVFPRDAQDAETLTNNADLAMYRAKSESAAGARYYDAALDEAIRERRALASDLQYAIESDQLTLHYQVQAAIEGGRVTGYEALARWPHPMRGSIPPSIFIPVAEENGLILALGEWVLRRACADAMTWDHDAKVAVNVSAVQLAHVDLPQIIHQILLDSGLPPHRLEIELTESAIMDDRDRALDVLRRIKALGIGVALDDFGTGHSSLATLRSFPFDKIKLDRMFILELAHSPQAVAIVRAVLALGKNLAIPVLAEGIETPEQLETLHREGCDEAQGYLLGRPSPSPIVTAGTIAVCAGPSQSAQEDRVLNAA